MHLFRRSTRKVPLPFLTDLHSHLLPGVDDGAPDVATSLKLIEGLETLGYRKLITTPHIYQDLFPNTPETLGAAYAVLMEELKAHSEVSLTFAAEYFMDDHLGGLLKRHASILTLRDNWVLVETSFVQPPLDLDQRVFQLQVGGYTPVIAHPERYPFWQVKREQYGLFREKGCLLQLNLLSLIGYYGKEVAETAGWLVRNELVDLVGTDCHHERHLKALEEGAELILRRLDPLLRKGSILNPSL